MIMDDGQSAWLIEKTAGAGGYLGIVDGVRKWVALDGAMAFASEQSAHDLISLLEASNVSIADAVRVEEHSWHDAPDNDVPVVAPLIDTLVEDVEAQAASDQDARQAEMKADTEDDADDGSAAPLG
jgi:hypothetical protein